MRIHHLAAGILAVLPAFVRVDAGGIARLSAVERAPRRGRLLRSSTSTQADDARSHHGPVQIALAGASELIEADAVELYLPAVGDDGDFPADPEPLVYDLDWRDGAGGGWHGRLRGSGSGGGTAHFAASPLDGLQDDRVAGLVRRGDGTTVRIATRPDGSHWFESWDDAGAGVGPRDPAAEDEDGDDGDYGDPSDPDGGGGSGRRLQGNQPYEFGDDDGSVIDHLSVYTRRGMCEHAMVGYYPCPDTPYVRAPIEEFIALQYTITNYAFVNTHLPTYLNAVHVFMDPDYDMAVHAVPTRPDQNPIGAALSHLKTPGSGHLEEARRRQDLYCADVVTLWGTEGLGLAGGPYSVVNHGSGGWGFAHEIGHNLEAGHRNDDPDKEGYKYGYGYGPDDSDPSYYATIMAFGGKKVPMYSTPDYTWEGKIVGTAKENNRQNMIDNLVKIGNKRRSEMCNPACEYGSDGTPLGCPSTCSKCHFPADFCYDDPFFRYQDEPTKHCDWVRFHTDTCGREVRVEDGREITVGDHCPVSCGTCPAPTPAPTDAPTPSTCEDDPAFLKNSNEGRGCDWVANDVFGRCPANAGDGYPDGDKIYDYCRLTCDLCHVNTPPPTPSPCEDVPGNHFQGGEKGCDWIAEKRDVRCDTYSKARTHCIETCDLCDAPTPAPTPRGPCADDDDWVYEAPKDKYSFLTCAWVREDPGERCGHSRIKHHCPLTCETCCEDEEGWHKGINGDSGGNPDKDCAYFGENGCNNAAMDHCPRTCGLCPNWLANAGGPDPYNDYDEYGRGRRLRGGGSSS